jgi:hypothetical protein
MAHVKILLSAVSAEFGSYRDTLRRLLTRTNVTVLVQEDFIVTGTESLGLLDTYVCECDAVIHLVGNMTGVIAQAPSVALIRERYPDFGSRLPVGAFLDPGGSILSYTQWEAWLALYHRKPLFIAVPEEVAARDADYRLDVLQRAAQQAHLQRLAAFECFPGIRFPDAIHLDVDLLRSHLHGVLARAAPDALPQNLTYASLGRYFKGREGLLDELSGRLGRIEVKGDGRVVALTGLGGIGKTPGPTHLIVIGEPHNPFSIYRP